MWIIVLLGLIVTALLSAAPFAVPTKPLSATATAQAGTDTLLITASNVQQLQELASLSGPAHSLAFSPDGTQLAVGADGAIRLLDANTLAELASLTGHKGRFISLAFSRDGKLLAASDLDYGTVQVWQLDTGNQSVSFENCGIGCYSLVFSPDEKTLFGGEAGEFGGVIIWNVATGKRIGDISDGSENYIVSMAMSPDGKLLALGKRAGEILLVDSATQIEVARLKDHLLTDAIFVASSGAFSPDGTHFAAGSETGEIGLWDVATHQQLHIMQGHTGWVGAVAFSSDGKLLVSAGSDKSVRVWDAITGQELTVLVGHTDMVMDVAFSPDGKIIASASEDATVKLWGVPAGE